MSPSTPPQESPPEPPTPRSHPQLTIFLTGATLLTLSSLLTRRSLHLRRRSLHPHFYHPSNAAPQLEINGKREAYQALGIATAHVVGFFVMMGGGLAWAFDVGGLEDFRRRVRGRRGVDGEWEGGGARGEGKEEEELREWVAKVTGGKVEGRKEEGEERRGSARGSEEDEASRGE